MREKEHEDVSEAYRESGPIEKQMGDRAMDNDFKAADQHNHSACNMQVLYGWTRSRCSVGDLTQN